MFRRQAIRIRPDPLAPTRWRRRRVPASPGGATTIPTSPTPAITRALLRSIRVLPGTSRPRVLPGTSRAGAVPGASRPHPPRADADPAVRFAQAADLWSRRRPDGGRGRGRRPRLDPQARATPPPNPGHSTTAPPTVQPTTNPPTTQSPTVSAEEQAADNLPTSSRRASRTAVPSWRRSPTPRIAGRT